MPIAVWLAQKIVTQSDDIKLQTVSLKIVSKMIIIIIAMLALIDLVGLSLK
jgi:hypothetical protein